MDSFSPKPSPFSVLKNKEFALYWSGQAISMVGTWMQVVAQSWVVVGFTRSAFVLGLINLCSSLPMMFLTLMGGVIADKYDKRRILMVTQFVLMCLAFALAGMYVTGHLQLWHLFVLAFFSGIASGFDMPASQAFTPELVERAQISQAIALNQASFNGSRILGPVLAGLLISALGTASAFIANGLSFLAVLFSLMFIRSRPRSKKAPTGSTLHSLKEGMRYIRQHRRLLVLMGLTALAAGLVFPNFVVMLPVYDKVVLGGSSLDMGHLMGASGSGALLGSLLLLGVQKHQRIARIGMGLVGASVALFTLSQSHFVLLSCCGYFVNSFSVSSMMGLSSTITQEVVPDHLRGRVMSLNSLMFVGVMPFSALILTKTADLVGIRNEMLGCCILFCLFGMTLFRFLAASPEIEPLHGPSHEPGRRAVPATD